MRQYLKSLLLTFGLVLATALPALAQTVPLGPRFVLPYQTVVDNSGVPIPGALLYFYASGTNIPLNTYSDPLLTIPNTNPVVANAAGVFPNIFLEGNYKIVLTDSFFNQIWTADPVNGSGSGGGGGAVSSVGNYVGDSTLTFTGTGTGPWDGNVTAKCTVATPSQIGCGAPDNSTLQASGGFWSLKTAPLADITGLGSGVAAALADNVGSAGAFVVNGGALGTPSSGVLTFATGLPLTTGVTGLLANANIQNPQITINSTTCTLGGACTPLAAASAVIVSGASATTITGGSGSGYVIADNAGKLGEVSSTISINSTNCTLGSTCSITASATSINLGGSTTGVVSGATNAIPYENSGGYLTYITTCNNGVEITSSGGVPSCSTTIPATTQGNITQTGTLTGGATGSGFTIALTTSTKTGILPTTYGGTGVDAPTSGDIYMGAGSSPMAVSALSDNGTIVSSTESVDVKGNALITDIANASSTGTTVNTLAKLTGAGTVVIAATSDVSGVVGIVVGGAGTTGSAQIAIGGQASCAFDGGTTENDYVQISSTVGGDCSDTGATYPSAHQVIGRVLSTNVAAGTYAILVFPPEIDAASGGGGGGVSSVTIIGGTGIGLSGSCSSTSSISCTINTPWSYSGTNAYNNNAGYVNISSLEINGNAFSTSAALAITAGTTGQLASFSSGTAIDGVNIASDLTAGNGINITGTTNATITASGIVVPGDARNLKIVEASTTTLTITYDSLIETTALGGTSYLAHSGSFTLNIATTGANALDTGSVSASSYYCIYGITKGDGSTFATLAYKAGTCSTIYPGANMPSGYVASALIGIWPTNGSSQFPVATQLGRHFWYQTAIAIFTATSPPGTSALTSQSISAAVPAQATQVDGLLGVSNNSNFPNENWSVASDSTGTGRQSGVSGGSGSPTVVLMSGMGLGMTFQGLPILTAQTIYWQTANTTGAYHGMWVTGFSF